jgi:Arc/MetJ family transcription regulator
MRTNIDVDDELMNEALQVTGERTKRAVVHRALRLLIDTAAQTGIRRLKGQVRWTGNLDESRQDRVRRR